MSGTTPATTAAGPKPASTSHYEGPTTVASSFDPLDPVSTLPKGMNLEELMGWLTTQMSQSDDLIRSQMASITADGAKQTQLSNTIERLRTMKMHADGDGKAVADKDFVDGSYRAEDWYKTMSPDGKKAVDSFAASIDKGHDEVWKDDSASPYGTSKLLHDAKVASGDAVDVAPGVMHVKGSEKVGGDAIDGTIESLKEELQSASSGNEMQMIKLQSAISARGQALQLVSNMIAAFHDTAKTIVGNTRAG